MPYSKTLLWTPLRMLVRHNVSPTRQARLASSRGVQLCLQQIFNTANQFNSSKVLQRKI